MWSLSKTLQEPAMVCLTAGPTGPVHAAASQRPPATTHHLLGTKSSLLRCVCVQNAAAFYVFGTYVVYPFITFFYKKSQQCVSVCVSECMFVLMLGVLKRTRQAWFCMSACQAAPLVDRARVDILLSIICSNNMVA